MKKTISFTCLLGMTLLLAGCSSDTYKKLCTDNNGTWLSDYRECEAIPQDICETGGGTFNECGSACRHQTAEDAEVQACTLQCVPFCHFDSKVSDNQIETNTDTTKTLEEETDNLTLKVEYPVTEDKAFNTLVNNFVITKVNDFKKVIGEERISPNWKNGFYITFETFSYSKDIRSYKFNIVEYSGGAHDNLYFKTFTYDFGNQKQLSFKNLFQEEHDPLWTIVPLTQKQLAKTIGDNRMMQMGTEGKLSNYENFALTSQELILFFPPYQVAPWAAGPQMIKLSWNDLNAILKPPFLKQ